MPRTVSAPLKSPIGGHKVVPSTSDVGVEVSVPLVLIKAIPNIYEALHDEKRRQRQHAQGYKGMSALCPVGHASHKPHRPSLNPENPLCPCTVSPSQDCI